MFKKLVISLSAIYIIIIAIVFIAAIYRPGTHNNLAHIVIQQEPDGLNPIFTTMSASSEIIGLIFKPMVYILPDGKPLPVLVEDIPTFENGGVELLPNGKSKKMRITWRFKKDLIWEDGKPLGPDDVIFAWKVILHDKVQTPSRDLEKRIESMEKDPNDPYKLIVTWKENYAYYFKGHQILPKHILNQDFKKHPERLHLHPYNRKPIGNGPFRIIEWKTGDYIYLKRNENYSKSINQPAKLDYVWYQFVGNTNSMIVSMLSGYVDAISPTGLSFDQALEFDKLYGKKYKTYFQDGITWEHIDCNLEDPILQNNKVRQALLYAINRDNLVKYLFYNKQSVAHSWLPPNHPGYLQNIRKYPYNPKKAIELLKQAGWDRVNGDGVRINKNNIPLNLTLMTTAGNKLRERVQIAIKNDLDDVGINLIINKNQNAVAFFGETVLKRIHTQLTMYAWTMSPISDGEEMWTSHNIPTEKNNWSGQNYTTYRNIEIDDLHKLIPTILDKTQRNMLFHKQQRIWIQDIPSIPLYFRKEVSITRKNFMNWKSTGTELPITWNCEEWELK